MITVLLHAPSKAVYDATMIAVHLPNGTPIAWVPPITNPPIEINGVLAYHPDVIVSELGEIMKEQPILDIDGNVVTPAVVVHGHHVNFWIGGDLEKMLTAGMPASGTIFERTRILALLGNMTWQPITAEGVPEGYEGTSGIRIFDPSVVKTPACVLLE